MKTLLVIVLSGACGNPAYVPVGDFDSPEICERMGAIIATNAQEASAPMSAMYMCIAPVPPAGS